MLANAIIYIITASLETGLVLAFVIWAGINRNTEELIEGCPVCGPRANRISLFFFWAGFGVWVVVGGSIKVASAINFLRFYNERFKDVEISYSLGSKHVPEEELTLVVIQ